jgi:hypothetical protein
MLDDAVKKYLPTKTITVRPNDKPFMNNTIRNKIRQRNRIHYKAEISAKIGAWVLYTGVRTSTELTNFFRLVIHRSIQVPVSVVKCVAYF